MDDAERILVEETLGRPPSQTDTPEQAAFRVKLAQEIRDIEDAGYIVEIPEE